MPHRPDTPCAGTCGRLLWSSGTSLPEGERMCRACRASSTSHPRPPRPTCAEPGCGKRPRGNDRCFNHRPGYVEYMRAHYRSQTHRRRRATAEQLSDITGEYERGLRAKAKRCPICQVRMIDQPYQPASKELDHIIPLNIGGTHTIGNVRIICRSCNGRRPNDGRDYQGPVTLWAQVPAELVPHKPTRKPMVCGCGQAKRNGRCWSCRPRVVGTPEQTRERGIRAATMRAGGMAWREIAKAIGYATESGAYLAARQHGDSALIERWPRYVRR